MQLKESDSLFDMQTIVKIRQKLDTCKECGRGKMWYYSGDKLHSKWECDICNYVFVRRLKTNVL